MQAPEALVIDFLASLQAGRRPYMVVGHLADELPALTVLEDDALESRFVQRERDFVVLTKAGRGRLVARS